jgi:hypothetical protein
MTANKKAQFFAIYLVFLTLFMCGIAIFLYFAQKAEVENSLVSPVPVLEMQDQKEIFEIQEKSIIYASLLEAKGNGWDASIKDRFKSIFLDYLDNPEQEQFRNFIISGLAINGVQVTGNFDLKSIYFFDFKDDELIITRKALDKRINLEPANKKTINFPVEVYYSYSRTWKCSSDLECK